jgi:hypothetical protein
MMSKVFIGGSISIKSLDDNIIARLNSIINKNLTVLIGDAYGADKEVQQYFASHKYKAVTVYTSSDRARNNIGAWNVSSIQTKGLYGRQMHTQKDITMTNDCDIALMLWDGKSIGTLNNIKRLLSQNKRCIVYANGRFYEGSTARN